MEKVLKTLQAEYRSVASQKGIEPRSWTSGYLEGLNFSIRQLEKEIITLKRQTGEVN